MGLRPPDVSATSQRAFRALLGYGAGSDWREGGTSWTQDYPRADRHFALALRRLTRVMPAPWSSPSTWTMATTFTTGLG